MTNNSQSVALNNQTPAPVAEHAVNEQPSLRWKYRQNEQTGKEEFERIESSNGEKWTSESFHAALKRATGTSDSAVGQTIIHKISYGLSAIRHEQRMNETSTLLSAMRPQDETEALLCGQFLALQDSGLECLRLAHLPEQGFYHEERFLHLANKLLATANQTVQTLLKYRTRGNITMQVVHVHNQQGQAIVAQNLAPKNTQGGVDEKNFKLNPMDD